MANEIKADGPTIGERVVATVTEGVKQGLAGLVIGGAAGAALGGLASYVLDGAKDVAVAGAQQALADGTVNIEGLTAAVRETTNSLNQAVASGVISQAEADTFVKITEGFVNDPNNLEVTQKMIADLGSLATQGTAPILAGTGAVVGGTLGGAAGGAKGAVEGLAYGNPTKWAERVAAKGTERGLENIMAKAMKEQQDFVAQIEAERKQQGSAPPTLAV